MKTFFSTLGVVVIGGAAIWGLAEFGFQMHAAYAPRYEDVRRETFEHSRAFQEGTIRDLDNLRLSYVRAAPGAEQDAIADTARHRLADRPIEQLPPELQDFASKVGAR